MKLETMGKGTAAVFETEQQECAFTCSTDNLQSPV
jgi:hypothetical protein